jgi:hypothetical protein
VGECEGTFPGQTTIGDEGAGQAQLGLGKHHEPGSPVGLLRMAHAWEGPVERLFEETKGMFEVESADIGSPDPVEVGDRRTRFLLGGVGHTGRRLPPQPQRFGRLGRLGEARDLDQDQRPTHQRAGLAGAARAMLLPS